MRANESLHAAASGTASITPTWWVPNPPFAEKASWQSLQSGVAGVYSLLEIPTDSYHFPSQLTPSSEPSSHPHDGDFSYPRVGKGRVRHSPANQSGVQQVIRVCLSCLVVAKSLQNTCFSVLQCNQRGGLAGLETQTQNAAFFECKRPKRKPWHRGKSVNRKKNDRNVFFER